MGRFIRRGIVAAPITVTTVAAAASCMGDAAHCFGPQVAAWDYDAQRVAEAGSER